MRAENEIGRPLLTFERSRTQQYNLSKGNTYDRVSRYIPRVRE